MLGIIIGIIIMCLGFNFGFKCVKFSLAETICVFVAIAGMFGTCFAVLAPLEGWKEPLVKEELELSSIYVEENGQEIYAIKADSGEYLIKYFDEEDNTTVTETIICEVVEDDTCEAPIKRTYEYEAKRGIWCLALCGDKEEEVLVLSERNIGK